MKSQKTPRVSKRRTKTYLPRAAKTVPTIKQLAQGVAAVKVETELPTVVYIHGIGNKPPAGILKVQWDRALFGVDMGARTRMAYWADIQYPVPTSGSLTEALSISGPGIMNEFDSTSQSELDDYLERLAPQTTKSMTFARKLGRKMLQQTPTGTAPSIHAAEMHAEILPDFIRRPVTQWLTKNFLRDVAAYFYDDRKKQEMRDRLTQVLIPQSSPYVLIAHSLGTVISYDVLSGVTNQDVRVPLFVTLGSPLGIQEVQDNIVHPLKEPVPVSDWRNFFDRLDPVALDQTLAGDFQPRANSQHILDDVVVNPDSLRFVGFNPHSGTGYLSTNAVQSIVRNVLGSGFASPLNKFVIAKDLATDISDSRVLHPVLIEIEKGVEGNNLTEKIDQVKNRVREIARSVSGNPELAEVDPLRRFVAAKLTAQEVYRLSVERSKLKIGAMWKNSSKSALVDVSTHTIQAYTAQLGYRATGESISWAILDTGIRDKHPHFSTFNNVASQWDCRSLGAPVTVGDLDGNGHGTHVAGIIAGAAVPPNERYKGIAPKTKLHIYKVLNDDGSGNDAWIIKALDHIASTNESSSELAVHGVNLSLGGSFDATVFACGYSPICRELRRLWQMGVVVCVAAGNEGRMAIETADGEQQLNLNLSIGDPANLDECIAVGSVHKEQPHMYGISYFSSRGPTADGRSKPDLVAPGEHINSCNARFDPNDLASLYVPLSGTSMACPHVSGLLSGFLSARREFIGHPDQVKEILLKSCTDLKRNIYHQGAGMPNAVKMLMST